MVLLLASVCEVANAKARSSMVRLCTHVQGEPILHRVHCSLNINTETGRLSARRPNLQNQPALEKDRYKVNPPFPFCPTKYRCPFLHCRVSKEFGTVVPKCCQAGVFAPLYPLIYQGRAHCVLRDGEPKTTVA